ncbi:hypothetical protein BH23CHL8_BH23CHL8_30300 [soil metagenome]
MIFVGIDWAEAHHDVCVLDAPGEILATRRIPEGLEGVARLHALLGEHADAPGEVAIGIETDRGLLVGALVAAGYRVYAINPLAASRYRERHTTRTLAAGVRRCLPERPDPEASTPWRHSSTKRELATGPHEVHRES